MRFSRHCWNNLNIKSHTHAQGSAFRARKHAVVMPLPPPQSDPIISAKGQSGGQHNAEVRYIQLRRDLVPRLQHAEFSRQQILRTAHQIRTH